MIQAFAQKRCTSSGTPSPSGTSNHFVLRSLFVPFPASSSEWTVDRDTVDSGLQAKGANDTQSRQIPGGRADPYKNIALTCFKIL